MKILLAALESRNASREMLSRLRGEGFYSRILDLSVRCEDKMKSSDRKLSNIGSIIVFLMMLQEGGKLVSRGFPREVNKFSGRETRVLCPGIKQFGFIVRGMKVLPEF